MIFRHSYILSQCVLATTLDDAVDPGPIPFNSLPVPSFSCHSLGKDSLRSHF